VCVLVLVCMCVGRLTFPPLDLCIYMYVCVCVCLYQHTYLRPNLSHGLGKATDVLLLHFPLALVPLLIEFVCEKLSETEVELEASQVFVCWVCVCVCVCVLV
jgi:hypothetical protein